MCYNTRYLNANERKVLDIPAPILTVERCVLSMATSDSTSNIPYGYCHCGCGQKTTVAKKTYGKIGIKKGEPYRFLKAHHKPLPHTLEQNISSFWSKVVITADDNKCWEWDGSLCSDGYGNATYNHRVLGAHRVAWMIPDYVIPEGMEVCHSCDNPKCVNPKHLFLGTRQDNMDDRNAKDRTAKGERITAHKLTTDLVIEIRNKYSKDGASIAQLANEYNVAFNTISCVVKEKTWKLAALACLKEMAAEETKTV